MLKWLRALFRPKQRVICVVNHFHLAAPTDLHTQQQIAEAVRMCIQRAARVP